MEIRRLEFTTAISTGSETYRKNRQDMLALIAEMHAIHARATTASEKRRVRFEERGQLTPRDRIAHLLDPGMPWLELYAFADYLGEDSDPETSVPGASSIAGIGYVSGTRVMVYANDSGINAGASTARTGEKLREVLDIALACKLPFLFLVESAGANLMSYRVENWARGGGAFNRMARLSAAGIPVISILHGPSTAGGAYFPGLSDYVIAVEGRGAASLGGAALVKAATGEEADPEELAGARMHATVSGLVEYLAENDADAIDKLRTLVARLNWNHRCTHRPPASPKPPSLDEEDILGTVPVDFRKPYDLQEVVARIVDGSRFEAFKPDFGPATLCLQADIMGYPVGILANNGPICTRGANKAAQFMQLCDQSDTALVFLHNITGFLVGTSHEQAGMVKHGAKMIQAVSNIRVPKIALHVGASFGAGNYGMAGHAFEPDFLFSWPNSASGVMGGEQAAITMEQVARAAAARKGVPVDEGKLAQQREHLTAHFDRQSSALFTSGRMLDQGVIDPRDTRRVIGFCLQTVAEARARELRPNSFGVARL